MDRLIRLLVLLIAASTLRGSVTAQAQQTPIFPGLGDRSAPQAPAAADKPAAELDRERKELAERLLVAQRNLESLAAAGDDTEKSEPLAREVDLLKRLDTVIAQRQTAAATGSELTAMLTEVTAQLTKLRKDGVSEERPYSFLLLDSIRDQLKTAEERSEALDAEIEGASEELERAKQNNEEAQAERRRWKEKRSDDGAAEERQASAAALKASELEASIAEQTLAMRRTELENVKTQKQIQECRVTLLEETVALVKVDVTFWYSDLQRQLVDIGKEESDLKQEIEAAECTLQALDRHWNEVRVRLASAVQKTPVAVEEERAAKLARDCHNKRILILQKQLGFLTVARETWKRRFDLARGDFTRSELAKWAEESEHGADQIDFERQSAELRLKDCRKDLAELDERAEVVGSQQPEMNRWIDEERTLVDQLSETYNAHLTRLDSHDNLLGKLIDELEAKQESLSLWDRLSATSEVTARIWNHELAEFDDHSVTVGKAVWGLGLLLFGVLASRWLTGRFARRLLSRLGIEGGAAVAFESLAYYVFVAAWVLVALRSVHVPLTVFAFMGGAVAIGVGFGCQKILNNFISGVILLVEQPIRVGDVIEIGGLQGTVETIGTRSTLIRTGANSEIIIPNSAFLESNVVNWTLGDPTARSSVRVVVARSAKVRDAARLLEQAATEHVLVFKNPAPFCWFADFSEHGFALELHFWLDIRNRRRIESDLRYAIDRYLREAGIELAPAPREAPAVLAAAPLLRAAAPQDDLAAALGDRSAA